ncbi:hypothetical protein [uncultured Actinomyces sp.]|uniref:hypothetical protein n=1 Tax=uncultured Actinomyces sp. TaxID=249061 RepID=UPI0028897558|nr:hypothetical protein [uncultured Actinomyces sp.]
MAPTKTQTVHSKIYWLFIVISVILGLPGTIGIYLWISNHTTHSVRIPVFLLALPIIVLIAASNAIDSFLVARFPNLVPESKRWMLAAGAQGQGQPAGPGPAQAVPAQAPAVPVQAQAAAGAQQAAYGYSQPGAHQPGAQPGAHRPDAYPPGGGAPVPYGYPQPGAAQQADYQQAGAHPQDSQPGAYRPGASAPSDYGSYGTTPPATGYGYGAPS